MPSTTTADLLKAVLAEPDEDDPRLILADWLEEHGDRERAEFIRVGCAIVEIGRELQSLDDCGAGNCLGCKMRRGLKQREREVLRELDLWSFVPWVPSGWTMTTYAHELAFRVGVKEGVQDIKHDFRCGFVESVSCTTADWLKHGPEIVACQPVTRVTLTDRSPRYLGPNPEQWCWAYGDRHTGPHILPRGLHLMIDGVQFNTEAAAQSALSAACLRWAKRMQPPR